MTQTEPLSHEQVRKMKKDVLLQNGALAVIGLVFSIASLIGVAVVALAVCKTVYELVLISRNPMKVRSEMKEIAEKQALRTKGASVDSSGPLIIGIGFIGISITCAYFAVRNPDGTGFSHNIVKDFNWVSPSIILGVFFLTGVALVIHGHRLSAQANKISGSKARSGSDETEPTDLKTVFDRFFLIAMCAMFLAFFGFFVMDLSALSPMFGKVGMGLFFLGWSIAVLAFFRIALKFLRRF
jgi:hypothetical protein